MEAVGKVHCAFGAHQTRHISPLQAVTSCPFDIYATDGFRDKFVP